MDPFGSWYANQIVAEGDMDYKPGQWEFFTLEWDAAPNRNILEQQIQEDDIDTWLDRQQKIPSSYNPGIDFLVARHKEIGNADIHRWQRPFRVAKFHSILEKLRLPSQYLYFRSKGSVGAGTINFHVLRDSEGKVSRISSIICPGHGSVTHFSTFWAFAFTWDSSTGRTTGFLDGITDSDLKEIKTHLKSFAAQLVHPLSIPEVFLHMIVTHLNERIRIPSENDFYFHERRTGLARIPRNEEEGKQLWSWKFTDFQESMAVTNKFLPTLAYLRRRFVFADQLTKRLLGLLDEMKDYEYSNPELNSLLNIGILERRERLVNRQGIIESYSHQVDCMLQRAENTVAVLSTTLSQIDSRTQAHMAKVNLQIANAVRHDSIPMRTIAYVTLVVLPGAFVAAIYGMNFFLFDPETKSLVVAHSFWQYWTVTIPLTAAVLIVWNIWVQIEKQRDTTAVGDEESTTFLHQSMNPGMKFHSTSALARPYL